MAAKNRDYWKTRMEALEDESYRRSAAYYRDVQEQFRQASNAMQMDIELWYRRLADNNGISYAAAKQLLKKNELEEFHWTVERYIEAGRENGVSKRWMKELENASAKFHINRLQAMKLQIQQHAELLFTEYEGGVTDFLHKSFGEQYYRTAWEISHGTEVGYSLARIDERKIDTLIKRPWAQDGRNFSDRIWSNKEKLVSTLHTELSQCIIRGEAPRTAVERLAHDMKVSRNQAGVLIMTETAALSSAAQKECFRELGVEQYEFLGTLDGQTCEVCQDMDKRVFRMADFEVGVTAPPIHPRCRCCTAPHFDDWEEFGTRLERAARDPGTDKTVYVDGTLDYAEWQKTFSSNGKKQKRYVARQEEWKRRREAEASKIASSKGNEQKPERPILGRDEIIEQAKLYGAELESDISLLKYDNGYPISNYLNEKLGYDKNPSIASSKEFERFKEEGKTILYRGVTDYKEISAHDMVEQFKYGKFFCGRGIYGYGTYTDTNKTVADYYAYDAGITQNGEVLEMILTDDAKVVDYLEIFTEYEKTGIPYIVGEKPESYQDVLDNVGAYASIKGYDAISLNGFQNKNHVVILNRGKVIVKE